MKPVPALGVTHDQEHARSVHRLKSIETLVLDWGAGGPGYWKPGYLELMRILVVDDEPSVAEVVAEAIRARGDGALVALDGSEALDLVMPGMSGLTVLARIRARHPSIPVVILSGHADDQQVREAIALGAIDVIKKPTVLAHLTDALARLKVKS